MRKRWPQAAAVMDDVQVDVLACVAFPVEHRTRLYSTNPLERLNKEVKRRTDVVDVLPDPTAVIRLVGVVQQEIDDAWPAGKRNFSVQSIRKLYDHHLADSLSLGVAQTGLQAETLRWKFLEKLGRVFQRLIIRKT